MPIQTRKIRIIEAANAVMQGQGGGGVIVHVGSLSGVGPSPGAAVEGAAKAGLVHLMGTQAAEWGPRVRVNCVSAVLDAEVALGRGTAEDVAAAVVFLTSPRAGYVSGAHLVVHGGGRPPAFLAALSPT